MKDIKKIQIKLTEMKATISQIKNTLKGAWLAQEHATLDCEVMSLSPTLGIKIT